MALSILRRSPHTVNIPSRYLAQSCSGGARVPKTYFHTTPSRELIKPYLLADIGEGITECRVVQWFVKPGDRVSQFDPICEVQSDKASVEITSRYDGVIASIHHEADEMAEVGKPLLDIDIEDDSSSPSQAPTKSTAEEIVSDDMSTATASVAANTNMPNNLSNTNPELEAKNSGLIVPAVRSMLKQHKIDIKDIAGSGKGRRVTKEDVQRHLRSRNLALKPLSSKPAAWPGAPLEDEVVSLTPIETQMFKVMTRALSIPHFGYSHSVDVTSLISLCRNFNKQPGVSSEIHGDGVSKLTALPFVMKAISQAFLRHPRLNAHLNTETSPQNPQLIVKASHNFGIAVDTPNGLLVPVVKDIQNRSILSIAEEIKRLSTLAKEGSLTPLDMSGATFTVSNIGSIGGSVVHPILVSPTVGIVAVGKVEEVPVFSQHNKDVDPSIVKREKAVLSWSADHRVLDGASVARCAQLVARVLENIESIGIGLR
ncbi:uncharacterized protein N7496_011459 [Penicillium cataractarum]|uniref:Dihydrolipoamide acetyltransferase component of pyruvate dehydrogenase complex n=1 Tax=Penicillium cataractarum TaxID=2100454 RepID=A0A9W9RFA8_9EURO|nr:uncharacterized protein N7496_011459 [Penicillium cataractarum]KAJ5359046.1 hypothetical protein N7496_011459 [Penicillium cataractarum]